MVDSPSVLVTICARGGSTRVPNKNIREIAGCPLVAHTIRQAKMWDTVTDIVVSTDSDEIAAIAEERGVNMPFKRPAHLADDEAAKLPVIQHAHEEMEVATGTEYDFVVDLDVTTPIRLVEDIEGCFQQVYGTDAYNAYSVTEADKNPYFNMVETDEDGYASLSKHPDEDIVRTQDVPDVYEMNASVYVYESDYLRNTNSIQSNRNAIYEMPRERSIDIDTMFDLDINRYLMEDKGVSYD